MLTRTGGRAGRRWASGGLPVGVLGGSRAAVAPKLGKIDRPEVAFPLPIAVPSIMNIAVSTKTPSEALAAVVSRLPTERGSVRGQVAVVRSLADELERPHDKSSASLTEQFEEELERLERLGGSRPI